MRYLLLDEISNHTGEKPDTIYRRAKRAGVIQYDEKGRATVPINYALPDEIIEQVYNAVTPSSDRIQAIIHKLVSLSEQEDTERTTEAYRQYGDTVLEYRPVREREHDRSISNNNLSIDLLTELAGDSWEESIEAKV